MEKYEFKVGDVVFRIGWIRKYVVCEIGNGLMKLGRVIYGSLYPVSNYVDEKEFGDWVKAGRWNFNRECEVEEDEV